MLRALKTSVERNLTDPHNVPIHKSKQNILKLFGRITSIVVANWKIYWFYGEVCLYFGLAETDGTLTTETAEKVFSLFQKGFRNLYNLSNWELAVDTCNEVLTTSIDLISSNILKYDFINSVFFINFANKKNASIMEIIFNHQRKHLAR